MSPHSDNFNQAAYDANQGVGYRNDGDISLQDWHTQEASVARIQHAMATLAHIIDAQKFPLGSPFEGYDVCDIVEMLKGECQPQMPKVP